MVGLVPDVELAVAIAVDSATAAREGQTLYGYPEKALAGTAGVARHRTWPSPGLHVGECLLCFVTTCVRHFLKLRFPLETHVSRASDASRARAPLLGFRRPRSVDAQPIAANARVDHRLARSRAIIWLRSSLRGSAVSNIGCVINPHAPAAERGLPVHR